MTKRKVAVFAAFITTTLFGGNAKGDEKNKNYNPNGDRTQIEYCYVSVRATTYHKNEPDSDPDTRRGMSSTGVKLREGKPTVVGTIAADPKLVPIGSLVLVTGKDGKTYPYLCVDIGGDVTDRTASRRLARREGRNKEWATRPVVDIYSSRENIHDWTTVLIVKDSSLDDLKYSKMQKCLEERMTVSYWLSRGVKMSNQRQLL